MRVMPHSTALNAAVLHMANVVCPTGFDVVPNAPASFPDLLQHYWSTGRIAVWDGCSDDTLYADREVNYAFRAWHDWAHIRSFADFTLAGEERACAFQLQGLVTVYGDGKRTREWLRLLDADCIGQARYHELWGTFPDPQRPFVLAYAMAENGAASDRVLTQRWHTDTANVA